MQFTLESSGGRRWELSHRCFFGRLPENDVVLDGPDISRRHALIQCHGNANPWLLDFASSNGTYLNDRKISSPAQLSDRDCIRIGHHQFYFRQPAFPPVSSKDIRNTFTKTTEIVGSCRVTVGKGVALAGPDGVFRCMSSSVQQWMREYFNTTVEPGVVAPERIKLWFKNPDNPPSRHASRLAPNTFAIEREGRCLVVECKRDDLGQFILLMHEEDRAFSIENLGRLGLTPRESEVARWIAEGKSNAETALILSISPRTVDKHVENIFKKLNVESRSAAMFRIIELLNHR